MTAVATQRRLGWPARNVIAISASDGGGRCTTGTDPDCTLEQFQGGGIVRGTHSYAGPGVYTVILTVSDDDDDDGGVAEAISLPIVVYDAESSFVTGGGWVDSAAGAYVADPSLAGKATFGFVSGYQSGSIRDPQGAWEEVAVDHSKRGVGLRS